MNKIPNVELVEETTSFRSVNFLIGSWFHSESTTCPVV